MKIAIIGAGNMGQAIAAGLAKGKKICTGGLICTARSQATLDKIRQIDPDIVVTTDNITAVKDAYVIMFAVKPWLMEDVILPLREHLDISRQIFVSVYGTQTLGCCQHGSLTIAVDTSSLKDIRSHIYTDHIILKCTLSINVLCYLVIKVGTELQPPSIEYKVIEIFLSIISINRNSTMISCPGII